MFLFCRPLLSVALILIAQMLAVPGWPSEREANRFGDSRSFQRGFRDHGPQPGRTHRERISREWHSHAGLAAVPLIGAAASIPFSARERSAATQHQSRMSGFVPPTQFSYYCDDPPGYFPVVAECAGGWRETGVQPSHQE